VLPVLDTTHTTLDACTRSLSFAIEDSLLRLSFAAAYAVYRRESEHALFHPFSLARPLLKSSSCSTCSTLLGLLYSTLPLYFSLPSERPPPPAPALLITLPTTGVRTDATTTARSLHLLHPRALPPRPSSPFLLHAAAHRSALTHLRPALFLSH
jgi:hypothetical protein